MRHNNLDRTSSWGGAKTLGSFEPAGNLEPEPVFELKIQPAPNPWHMRRNPLGLSSVWRVLYL